MIRLIIDKNKSLRVVVDENPCVGKEHINYVFTDINKGYYEVYEPIAANSVFAIYKYKKRRAK